MKFLHVGIPTKEIKGKEEYLKDLKVYFTSSEDHPYSIEYLRYDKSSPIPMIIQREPHIAYEVESISEALKGVDEVIVKPFKLGGTIIALVIKDSLILELHQSSIKL